MATEAKLCQLADRGCPVYYFYSSERYLVRQAVSAAVRILSADTDEETTVLDGTAPEAHHGSGHNLLLWHPPRGGAARA